MSAVPEYVLEVDFAAMCGASHRTARRRRSTGDCPPFVRIGRGVVYPRAGINEWMASRTFTSNADEIARKRLQQQGGANGDG